MKNIVRRTQGLLEKGFKSPEHNESVLRQSSRWASSITWGLIATTGLSVSWLALAKTEEIAIVRGNLVPIGSVQEIQMPLGGIIEEILVKEGDSVKANDVLIRLDTESTKQQYQSRNKSLEDKKLQLELKKIELKQFERQNSDILITLENKLEYEKDILNRFESLAAAGASSELQKIQQMSKVVETEGRIRETKIDGLRQVSILKQNIQLLKIEISSLESKLTDARMTLRYQELRAPVDGIIFDLQPKGRGYTGQTSETLMKVVPLNALEAKVEIPSSDIGFVRTGMNADLSIDSFPASDFGVLEGKITRIGSDALPPEPSEQKAEYRYPAVIALSDQFLKTKNNTKLDLQPGMSLTANIKLLKVSYLQLLLGSFKDKTDSLKEI